MVEVAGRIIQTRVAGYHSHLLCKILDFVSQLNTAALHTFSL